MSYNRQITDIHAKDVSYKIWKTDQHPPLNAEGYYFELTFFNVYHATSWQLKRASSRRPDAMEDMVIRIAKLVKDNNVPLHSLVANETSLICGFNTPLSFEELMNMGIGEWEIFEADAIIDMDRTTRSATISRPPSSYSGSYDRDLDDDRRGASSSGRSRAPSRNHSDARSGTPGRYLNRALSEAISLSSRPRSSGFWTP